MIPVSANALNPTRFRALALFGRRPPQRVDRPSIRQPKACTRTDSCAAPKFLLDHIICEGNQGGRNFEAERLRGPEINDRLVLSRRLDREIGRLFAFKNTIDVAGSLSILLGSIRAVGNQAAAIYAGRQASLL